MMFPNHSLAEDSLVALLEAAAVRGATSAGTSARTALRTRGLAGDAARLDAEHALFRMVSVTEAYLDATALDYVGRFMELTVPEHQLLLTEWEIASSANWQKRADAFKKFLGFKLEKCSEYPLLMAAVQARNAIAHGLGRLTARQRSNRNLPRELAAIDIAVVDGRIRLGSSTLSTTRNACFAFISDVDGKVPTN